MGTSSTRRSGVGATGKRLGPAISSGSTTRQPCSRRRATTGPNPRSLATSVIAPPSSLTSVTLIRVGSTIAPRATRTGNDYPRGRSDRHGSARLERQNDARELPDEVELEPRRGGRAEVVVPPPTRDAVEDLEGEVIVRLGDDPPATLLADLDANRVVEQVAGELEGLVRGLARGADGIRDGLRDEELRVIEEFVRASGERASDGGSSVARGRGIGRPRRREHEVAVRHRLHLPSLAASRTDETRASASGVGNGDRQRGRAHRRAETTSRFDSSTRAAKRSAAIAFPRW